MSAAVIPRLAKKAGGIPEPALISIASLLNNFMIPAGLHRGMSYLAIPPTSYRVSPRVSPKTGVSDGVSHGVSPGPFGPRAPECPKSVPRVSPECPGHLFDTLGTPFGHSGAGGPKGPKDTPWDTPSDTPVFGDTLGDTSWDTRALRARGTPCSWSADRKSYLCLALSDLADHYSAG